MARLHQTFASQPSSAQTPTVLIVEDEPVIADAVRELLEDEAIAADVCPLGWQALLWVREQQPRVVILDVAMPNVDGITLFYSLRNDPKTRDIPVIFLTASPRKVLQELPNLEEMGAILVPKPFDLDTLLDIVSHALARERQAQ